MRHLMMIQNNKQTSEFVKSQHLNGAAIIDAAGREIPITEEMIQAALHAMEDTSFQPSSVALAVVVA